MSRKSNPTKKIQPPFMIKTFKKLEKKLLQPDKRHHKKQRANLHNER